MSRSGYSECDDYTWDLIRWRGAVASAIRGKRGQALLRDLRDALDAMPAKRLIEGVLATTDGEVCVLGALGRERGVAMAGLNADDPDTVAATFNIAPALAKEIVFHNDEARYGAPETPEQRWTRMRAWVDARIVEPVGA